MKARPCSGLSIRVADDGGAVLSFRRVFRVRRVRLVFLFHSKNYPARPTPTNFFRETRDYAIAEPMPD